MAWLQDHLAALFSEKQTFMTDFVIANEEQAELKLVGQLHRSEKGEVGVEWQRVEGNDYWLTNVENSLNSSLQSLA